MRRTRTPVLILLLFIFAGGPPAVSASVIAGRVVAVQDGDTLTLLTADRQQHRVRLGGIDAPERGQPFGERSRQRLADQVFGKDVRADCPRQDRFGRAVCTVFVGPQDVGLGQVEEGLAWWYRRFAAEQSATEQASYSAAEDRARSARRGLWRDPVPVAPWDWRRSN